MSQCDVTRQKSAQKRPKQRLSGGCAMGAYLALTCTYLVSNSTYYCKLSFNGVPTGEDHCDICLAGVWLHKERFLRTSSIVTGIQRRSGTVLYVQLSRRVRRTLHARPPASVYLQVARRT